MTTPLLDLAARPPQAASRCLVLAESDRARAGSSVAVLLRDPSTTSPHWPLALAAYRRIWSGYKAHAPVVSTTALLTQVADTFASEPDLIERPDLVAAFLTVEGVELSAWALPTALVLVRQGDELGELGPYGFSAVPAAASLARGGERSGLWHGRLSIEAGVGVCLIERATAARLGSWRLRHALGAASAADILAELGVGEEAAVAGRVVRIPELASGRLGPVELQFAPALPAEPADEGAPPVRGTGRRQQEEMASLWSVEPVPNPEAQPAEEPEPSWRLSTKVGAVDDAPPAGALAGAEAQSAAGTAFPLGTGSGETGILLPGRRGRGRSGGQLGGGGLRDAFLSWSGEVLDDLGEAGRTAESGSQSFLLRRVLVWASLGVASILVLAILILIGRLLMGPRLEGPPVSPGLELSGAAATATPKAAAGRESDGTGETAAVPAAPAAGASWTRRLPDPISSSPLIQGEQIIVGCRDGNVYALALADGSERWRLSVGAGVGSSPTAAGSLVVVGTYSGDVVAAEAETGRERWRATTGGKIVSSAAFFGRAGIVAIGSHDRHIYGLAVEDGAVRWKVHTGGIIWASPIIAKDRIVVGSHDGALYCLDAASGRVEWRAVTGGPISSTATVWRDRSVVVGSADGQVHAFRLADGKPLWSHRVGGPVGSPLTAAGDLVLAGTDAGELLALAGEDGGIRYRVRTGGPIKSRPAVNQGQVWFTSYDGRLRVVDLESGRALWSFPASGQLYSIPALLGRTAFFGSMNWTLYAATWTGERGAKL